MRQKKAKELRKLQPKMRTSISGIDATKSDGNRERVMAIEKEQNGNMSKFIPAKWGYGPMGGLKY